MIATLLMLLITQKLNIIERSIVSVNIRSQPIKRAILTRSET